MSDILFNSSGQTQAGAGKRVTIALSGGVDSAVAAYLLKQQGYDCEGVTLKLTDNAPYPYDAEDATNKLGIPFRVIDARQAFDRCVIREFVNGYLNGGTPNPCVDCNRAIKFGVLGREAFSGGTFASTGSNTARTGSEFALTGGDETHAGGTDFVATGHYARIENGRIKRAADIAKDQSYVLYTLTGEQLSRTLFPLGGLTKKEVRAIAAEQGFAAADKPESQDICFVPDGDYAGFIENYTGTVAPPGNFIDENGGVLGRHNGLIRYTIGQRKGFGIAFRCRMFVSDKNAGGNTVTLTEGGGLYASALTADNVNWTVTPPKTGERLRLQTKTRYNQKETAWAYAAQTEDGRITVTFEEPQRAVAKGQHVVLYDGDYLVGGGRIDAVSTYAVSTRTL